MYKVLKRNRSLVDFDLTKIAKAIEKAFTASGRNWNSNISQTLALRATADYEPKIKNDIISVEDIQDSVETTLALSGYSDVAKCYILYRKQHENSRNAEQTMLDYK